MDPNANLAAQNRIVSTVDHELDFADKRRLRELREALQDWLNHSGFAPDWKQYPLATTQFRKWVRNRAKFADLYR